MNKNIILFSGGTGGHVIPAIIFGNFLIDEGFNCALVLDKRTKKYSGTFKGDVLIINSSHLSGNYFFKMQAIFSLFKGFFQSVNYILKYKPDICISFGGYATLMPLLSIMILRLFKKTNIYLHEQNSVIGRVNSLILPFAKNIFTNFKLTKNIKKKFFFKKIYVGLPSLKILFKDEIKKNIWGGKKTIFIYGGSQGSILLINNFLLLLESIDKSVYSKIRLIVQSNKLMHKKLNNIFDSLNIDYEVNEFYKNINEILSITDLAITRAGAGTINDLVNYRIPSMIMPLSNSIQNHQFYNAKFLSDSKAAYLLDENNFDVKNSQKIFLSLIFDENKISIIKDKLAKVVLPDANNMMLNYIKK